MVHWRILLAVMHDRRHDDMVVCDKAIDGKIGHGRYVQFACAGNPARPAGVWKMLQDPERLQNTVGGSPRYGSVRRVAQFADISLDPVKIVLRAAR